MTNTLTGSLYSSHLRLRKVKCHFFSGQAYSGSVDLFRIGQPFFAGSNAGATWDAFLPIFLCTSLSRSRGRCPLAPLTVPEAAAGCGVTGSLLFVLSASSNLFPQTVQKRKSLLFAFWQTGQITVPEFSSFFSLLSLKNDHRQYRNSHLDHSMYCRPGRELSVHWPRNSQKISSHFASMSLLLYILTLRLEVASFLLTY